MTKVEVKDRLEDIIYNHIEWGEYNYGTEVDVTGAVNAIWAFLDANFFSVSSFENPSDDSSQPDPD